MTRDEYLQILRDNLTTMTDDEKDDVIRYYLEYFSDSGDEWEAMEELGAPEKLAARLCSGNGAQNSENYSAGNYTSTQNTAKAYGGYNDGSTGAYDYSWEAGNTKRKKSPGKIIALACTAPIWVPLAFAVFVVFAACVIAGIASVAAGFFAFGKSLADGLLVLGSGLFMLGAGILAFFLGTYIVKGVMSAFKMFFNKN